MSTSLSITVDAEMRDFPSAFVALTDRIIEPRSVVSIERYRTSAFTDAVAVSVEVPGVAFAKVVESLWHSNESLTIQAAYRLIDEELIPLSIHFRGIAYYRQVTTTEGRCRLDFPAKPIIGMAEAAYRVEEVGDEVVLVPLEANEARDKMSLFDGAPRRNAEELFLRVCGLDADRPGEPVEYAAMYTELDWWTPPGCSIVYHRSPAEFARDFLRIYAEYQWGVPMGCMASRDVDIWELEHADLPVRNDPGKTRPEYYESHDSAVAPLTFVQGLNRQRAERLSKIPTDKMHGLMKSLPSQVRGLACYDHGESGMVLSAGPMQDLWPAYIKIAEMVE